MKKFIIASSLALALASSAFAASWSYSAINGGSAAGSNKVNFDTLTLGSAAQSTGGIAVAFTGAGKVVTGSVSNQYAAPVLSANNGDGFGPGGSNQANGKDKTHYLSAGIGSITLSFASSQNYLGLLWGSVDDYNSLEFFSGGVSVGSFTGLDVTASANGDRGAAGTFYVNFLLNGGSFDSVVATSTTNSFEIDNVSYATLPVPDSGTTVALLGAALAGMALVRRKR